MNNKEIRCKLLDLVRQKINEAPNLLNDEQIFDLIEEEIFSFGEARLLSGIEKYRLVKELFYSVRFDLGILTPYVDDKEVQEIMVNGPENIFIERKGRIEKADFQLSSVEELEEIIRRIASDVRREINEKRPILDARLKDGSRVSAVYKNIALNGPSLNIRKFSQNKITMENLQQYKTITEEARLFLKIAVKSGYNIFISGGTSSGKTTFLNALSEYIPENERVIVIEDSAELKVAHIKNHVRLECRNSNTEGKGEVNIDELIKASLRMRPDRIIIGEVRGKECFGMLQAMNTGHDGSMSTGHANSIEGMLKRLETMYLQAVQFPMEAIRAQISEGIDIIVHLGKIEGKGRRVLEIAELEGCDGNEFLINTLFKYNVSKGLVSTGNILHNKEKMRLKGMDFYGE